MTGPIQTYQIIDKLKGWKEDMLRDLRCLVEIETPTSDKHSQANAMAFLSQKLEETGMACLHVPGKISGGTLLARPKIRLKNKPIQLLIGHCDTVWPLGTLAERPVHINDGKMQGPGVYDMKAGLIQIIYALQLCQELDLPLPCSPVVLINSDEEKGSRESTVYIRRLAKIARRAYILEPPLGYEGNLKTARKGIGRFTVKVQGKPAHAGLDPGKGASAIVELSHIIQKLFRLNDPQKGISVNVGQIEGGISPNVIAPASKAVIDVRALTMDDASTLEKEIKNLTPEDKNTTLTVSGSFGRLPMEKTPASQALWELAQQKAREIGLDLDEGTAGGGSDGNTTSQYIATLDGLGTPGDGAHAEHEFIFTEKIIERTALLTLLIASHA